MPSPSDSARHAEEPEGLDRLDVAAALREVATLLDAQGGNPYRARAYERGARSLEALSGDFRRIVEEGRLTEIPGIGESLAAVIAELATTGRTSVLDRLRTALPPGAGELGEILGLSRMKALHDALGIESVDDLEAACREGRVRTVKGFGAKTEARILEKIRDRAEHGHLVALDHALEEAERLVARLREVPGIDRAEVAGALRRRVEVVEGADVVVAARDREAAIAALVSLPQVARSLPTAQDRVVLHLAGGLVVHVRVVEPEVFVVAWHDATGSAEHLAELGAFDGAARKEAEIYERLGLPCLPPEVREGAGEVAAARDGRLDPARLVVVNDVRGAVHCHTLYSDGTASVEEMALAAEEAGFDYITITDHSPTARYAGAMTLEKLRRQWDEIDEVQERVSVRILRGTESDILADGSLDWPDDVLEELDVIVASIHERHRLDEDAMTERIVRAMRLPVRKVWGHALGRLILRRPPIACRVEEVLDAIAASGGIVEINGDPRRLDLEPRWVRAARERGIRFVISSDAHSVRALSNFEWGVAMARRGWVTRDEVLNALDVDGFRAAVSPVR